MRPITAVSAFRAKRRKPCGCPAPMNDTGCWRSSLQPARSTARAAWCTQPAGLHPRPIFPRLSRESWRSIRDRGLTTTLPCLPRKRRDLFRVPATGMCDMNVMTRVTQSWPLHARFEGPIVMVGFGSIGRGTLPLIERHIGFDRSKFVIIAPDDENAHLLDGHSLRFMREAVTTENFRDLLTPLLTSGPGRGMIVNLSVDTSSVDLMAFARDIDAFYLDTVVEPWPGLYTDGTLSPSARSNYALREGILDLRRRRPGGITAVSCCGANPGMVSWMVKKALVDIAKDLKLDFVEPGTRQEW